MLKLKMAVLLTIGMLAGCGRVVVFGHTIGEPSTTTPATTSAEAPAAKTESPPNKVSKASKTDPAPSQAVAIPAQAVSAVTFVPTAVGDDSRFKTDALLEAVKGELRLRKLLDDTDARASTAEISIDEFAIRPTSNAVLFGYIISNGALNGEVRIRDTAGNYVQSYRIEAKSRLTAATNDAGADYLRPLYHRFAILAGDKISGAPSKSDSDDERRYR